MAQIHRFRHADPKRVRSYAVNSATVIEVGDQVYMEVDDVRPASDLTYMASLDLTQRQFAAQFVGIAMTASASGETAKVTVAQAGTFEFICAAAQFEIGDGVGPDDNAAPDALLDQQVIATGEDGTPIAFVTERYNQNTTSVRVEIVIPGLRLGPMQRIHLGFMAALGTADELVTDMTFPWPFKLVALQARVQTIMGAGNEVLTIHKNAGALDDTLTLVGASVIGVVVNAAMVDATGDDIFAADDTLSVLTDGGSASGAADLYAWVRPFVNES